MNIAIVSVFDVSLLEDFVYPEYRESIRTLNSNFTPAVAALTLEFLKKGENVIIFTQDVKAHNVEIFHGERVSIYVAPKISKTINILTCGLYTHFAIKKLFRFHKGPIDVVSAHWTRDYAMAAKEFLNKIPVFVTIRDIIPNIICRVTSNRFRWRMIWLKNEYVLRKKGYRYIANSNYTAHEVKRLWGHDVPVIPNSISICENIPLNQNSSKDLTKEIVITSISLSDFDNRWKNIPTLLKSFSIFKKTHQNAILNLVGPYFIEENGLVQEYKKAGLMVGVRLMGKRTPKEIVEILNKSTMMVHPSYEETFGNTLIEAMACGTPVIGGLNSGAVPWVLDHGRLGYLCDISSPEDIAENMEYIVENYDEAMKKASKGKEICQTTYCADSVADEYLRLFRESVDRKPQSNHSVRRV